MPLNTARLVRFIAVDRPLIQRQLHLLEEHIQHVDRRSIGRKSLAACLSVNGGDPSRLAICQCRLEPARECLAKFGQGKLSQRARNGRVARRLFSRKPKRLLEFVPMGRRPSNQHRHFSDTSQQPQEDQCHDPLKWMPYPSGFSGVRNLRKHTSHLPQRRFDHWPSSVKGPHCHLDHFNPVKVSTPQPQAMVCQNRLCSSPVFTSRTVAFSIP